jgi:Flp pilus assembly protein TadB
MTDSVKPANTAEVIIKDESAAEQARALQALATAAAPVIQQVMDTSRATAQDRYSHQLRMTEIDERMENGLHRRLFPLVWLGALVTAAVILWACFVGRWEIATHLLTAIVAGGAGWVARSQVASALVDED